VWSYRGSSVAPSGKNSPSGALKWVFMAFEHVV
jgi:hypothetical protein